MEADQLRCVAGAGGAARTCPCLWWRALLPANLRYPHWVITQARLPSASARAAVAGFSVKTNQLLTGSTPVGQLTLKIELFVLLLIKLITQQ